MFLTKPSAKQYYHFQNKDNNMKDEKTLSVALTAHYYMDSEELKVYHAPEVIPPDPEVTNGNVPIHVQSANDNERRTTTPNISIEKLREKPILLNFHDVKTTNDLSETAKDEFEHLDAKSLKLLWH
jgi:hypothetical protein